MVVVVYNVTGWMYNWIICCSSSASGTDTLPAATVRLVVVFDPYVIGWLDVVGPVELINKFAWFMFFRLVYLMIGRLDIFRAKLRIC